MKKHEEERIAKCLASINELINDFQTSSFKYLLESDIQCDLFQRMRSNIEGSINIPSGFGEPYMLDIVYSEYLDRFDLCCLDEDKIESMKKSKENVYFSPNGKHDEYIYHLPVLLAIELKFIKGKYRQKHNFQKFLDDRVKIENGLSREDSVSRGKVKKWICICFIQDEEVLKFQMNKFERCDFLLVNSIDLLNSQFVVSPSKIYKLIGTRPD